MRYGAVGGLAGVMGWTKVQEEEEPGTAFFGGPMRVIALLAVLAALDYAWIGALAAPHGPAWVNPACSHALPGTCTALTQRTFAAGYDYFAGTGK